MFGSLADPLVQLPVAQERIVQWLALSLSSSVATMSTSGASASAVTSEDLRVFCTLLARLGRLDALLEFVLQISSSKTNICAAPATTTTTAAAAPTTTTTTTTPTTTTTTSADSGVLASLQVALRCFLAFGSLGHVHSLLACEEGVRLDASTRRALLTTAVQSLKDLRHFSCLSGFVNMAHSVWHVQEQGQQKQHGQAEFDAWWRAAAVQCVSQMALWEVSRAGRAVVCLPVPSALHATAKPFDGPPRSYPLWVVATRRDGEDGVEVHLVDRLSGTVAAGVSVAAAPGASVADTAASVADAGAATAAAVAQTTSGEQTRDMAESLSTVLANTKNNNL